MTRLATTIAVLVAAAGGCTKKPDRTEPPAVQTLATGAPSALPSLPPGSETAAFFDLSALRPLLDAEMMDGFAAAGTVESRTELASMGLSRSAISTAPPCASRGARTNVGG